MDKKEKKPDPFASMGPPGIMRRFRHLTAEVHAANEAEENDRLQSREEMLKELKVIAEKAHAANEREHKKHAGGRPAKVGRPWEGICSKTEWYRRQKREKADESDA